jgi:hypothetical protein
MEPTTENKWDGWLTLQGIYDLIEPMREPTEPTEPTKGPELAIHYRSPVPLSPRPEARRWALNPPHPVNEIYYQRTIANVARAIERERYAA